MVDLAYKYPELLTFLAEHQLIKAADVDSYVAEAEKSGNTEQKACLLDYQNRIGLEKVKKGREKKKRIKEEYLDTLSERMKNCDPSNGLEGITFMVTGKLWSWKSRDEIKEYLESYGASLGGSVNKKTDYLVVSDPKSQSEKTKKAESLGVQVISETEFNDMIGKRYKDAAHVSVPKWIRTIPEGAFVCCKSMTDVSIPEGVTIIGDKAFEDCRSLKHVELPEGLTEIGEEAFHNCVGIESLTLPANVTRIGKGAFHECGEISFTYGRSELRELVYESSFRMGGGILNQYVGPGGNVVVPEGVTGFFLFPFSPSYGSQSQVTGITLPESMTVISSSAFSGCSKLERVVIPESVRRIEKAAFMSCAKLAEIKLPERLDELGTEAFSYCNSLTSVVIPETVTVLEEGVFSNYANLEQVTLPSSITEIKPRAFSGCKKLRSLILPEGLRKIGANAFTGCDCLAEINIPENVIEIGREAFGGCDSLKQVIIPDSVAEIGARAFYGCSGLESIILPKGLENLNEFLFYSCESLTSVEIPSDVTSIGSRAMAGTCLKTVKIPKSVTSIGGGAFAGCNSLMGIDLEEENADYCVVDGVLYDRDKKLLLQYPGGRSGNYTVLKGVEHIGLAAFWRSGLSEVVLPKSTKCIEDYAFTACKMLTKMEIPENVTEIGNRAFSGCEALTDVIIPESVTKIGDYCFANCANLTIHAAAGSYAEKYAKEHGIPFAAG